MFAITSGPALEANGLGHLNVLGYDQNRAGLDEWTASMYRDSANVKYFAGTAIHWYESTYDYFPDDLDRAHEAAPEKLLIETEGCIDAEVPVWQDDDWYWQKEATDWGFTWREEEKKYLHPKYAPVNRYARDIIGCLNHWVNGWVDWNMVLDRQGGPNWFKNWCIAPVIVDPEQDEVYFTPLYDVMCHFSKFIRPGATVLASECADDELMAVATETPDGGHIIVCFNPGETARTVRIEGLSEDVRLVLGAQSLQTVVLNPQPKLTPMATSSTPATTAVPMGQKIAFGFGMLANQMFPAALGVFIIVLVQDLGFAAMLWGIIQFLPRIFDAITDPIMGFISDNTRSKYGRRRQYVFIGGILMGIAYIAMWQLHKGDGITYNFIYFLSWSLVFYLGLTIFSVPYVAMGYEISEDFHERTQIMAVAQFIGQWAWVIAPWFWVILYDPSWFPGGAGAGVRELSIWVAIPCTLFALIPAVFLKTESTLDRTDFAPINVSAILSSVGKIFSSAFEAFRIKQFRQIAGATFLIFNSFNVIAAFTFLIIVHHMFNSDPASAGTRLAMHGSVGALITTFLIIPVVTYMSKKLGKKRAFMVSQGSSPSSATSCSGSSSSRASRTSSSSPCRFTPSASVACSPS